MTELVNNIYSLKKGDNTFHFSTETVVNKGTYFIVHITQITDFRGTELENDFDNGLCVHNWKIQCKHEKSEMGAISFAGRKLIKDFDKYKLRYKC